MLQETRLYPFGEDRLPFACAPLAEITAQPSDRQRAMPTASLSRNARVGSSSAAITLSAVGAGAGFAAPAVLGDAVGAMSKPTMINGRMPFRMRILSRLVGSCTT